jgi:hypothetical protein
MSPFHHFEAEENFEVEIRTADGVTSYLVNGTEYSSIDDVPPRARALIERIRNTSPPAELHVSDVHTSYEINGVKYENLEDVPQEYRGIIGGIQGLAARPAGQSLDKAGPEARRYCLDGQEYCSFDEMAPALQKKIEDMIAGPHTTIEYVTSEGVTRKYVDGEEVPLRPGEVADAGILSLPADREDYGPIRESLPQSELYKRIVVNRAQSPEELRELDNLSSSFREAEGSRQVAAKLIGRIITTAAYAALILWSQFQPAGFSSYIYAGFLTGDIVSWLIYTAWGWQKNLVEFDYRDLGIRVAGLFFFILLTTRQGAFEVAAPLRNQAIAVLVMMAVVAAFAKWTTRVFGLIKRITEGY